MSRTPYEELLHYRGNCGMDPIVSIRDALDDLICSHRWMNIQLEHIGVFMDELKYRGAIDTTVDNEGTLDVFQLIMATDRVLLHREALLEVVEKNNLLEEYSKVIDRMISEMSEGDEVLEA